MRPPQSENSSSPRVHSTNLQRELTKLIDHVEADTKRVDDPRFRGLLEKSVEVLRGLRTLFERYGQGSTTNGDSRGRRTERKGAASRTSSRAGGNAPNQAKPRPKNTTQGMVAEPATIKVEDQETGHRETDGNANAIPPGPPLANPKPVDPDEVAARIRQQRKEARAPKMPGGRSAPKPMPPRSGKPVFSKPHSS